MYIFIDQLFVISFLSFGGISILQTALVVIIVAGFIVGIILGTVRLSNKKYSNSVTTKNFPYGISNKQN